MIDDEILQGIEYPESFTEIVHTMSCNAVAPVSSLINSSYKSHLPFKVEGDGFYSIESCENSTKVVQALICEILASFSKSTNSSYKIRLLLKVEVDGL